MAFKRDRGVEMTPEVINKLYELIGLSLEQAGVVVLLDRLDEEWDGSDDVRSCSLACSWRL